MPPPPPSEPRPLYEVIEEVKTKVGSDGEIFASTHGYKMPSHMEAPAEINISKVIPDSKAADKEDEKKKKEKEKKDKYKVKF